MASTLSTSFTLSSADVSTDALAMTVTGDLLTKTPSLGISRVEAPITTAAALVPATAGTKYCYVKHMALKSNGTTTSSDNVILSSINNAPVRQITTLTLDADLVTSNSFTCTVDGTAIGPVVFDTTHDVTMIAIAAAIQAHANIFTCVASARVLTITGHLGEDEAFVIANDAVTLGASQAGIVDATPTPASGHYFALLRPLEWTFLPVTPLAGLQAISTGAVATDGITLEYAYWTKSAE